MRPLFDLIRLISFCLLPSLESICTVSSGGNVSVKGLPTLRLEAKGLKAWAFRRSVFRYMGHEA